MRPIRERIRTAGPVVEKNVQGSAIAKLFRLPDAEAEFAATVQQFALAGVVEALIVLSMVSFELLGSNHQGAIRKPVRRRWLEWFGTNVSSARRFGGPAAPANTIPAVMPSEPQVLNLVAVRNVGPAPAALIPKILTAALNPAAGERVEMAELYRRYRVDCAAEGSSAVSAEQFADPLKRFCKGAGIRTKIEGQLVFLLNVRIGDAQGAVN